MRRFVAVLGAAFSMYFMGCMAGPTEDANGEDLASGASVEEEVAEAAEALNACGSGLCCALTQYSGMSGPCQSGSQVAFCCPYGYGIAASSCVPYCPSGRSCGTKLVSGASACAQGCSNGSVGYCCPLGKTYTTSGCI